MVKNIYRFFRSLVVATAVFAVVIYTGMYILLSFSGVEDAIKDRACSELSEYLGGKVTIGSLDIIPFNEAVISDLEVFTPEGDRCLLVKRIGAGIRFWRLITSGEIELTYGEIMGLDAAISQKEEGGPLNIAFIIEAFSPKDKNKKPTPFHLDIKTIVLRGCRVSFDREWQPVIEDPDKTDFNHLVLNNLKADLAFPLFSDKGVEVSLRRMSFDLSGGLEVNKIALKGEFSKEKISVKNLVIAFGSTYINPNDFEINVDKDQNITDVIKKEGINVVLNNNTVCPADLGFALPVLRKFNHNFNLDLSVFTNLSDLRIEKLDLTSPDYLRLNLSGEFEGGISPAALNSANLNNMEISISKSLLTDVVSVVPSASPVLTRLPDLLGNVEISISGHSPNIKDSVSAKIDIESGENAIELILEVSKGLNYLDLASRLKFQDIGLLTGIDDLGEGKIAINYAGNINRTNIAESDGELEIAVERLQYKDRFIDDLTIYAAREAEGFNGAVSMLNDLGEIELDFNGVFSDRLESGFLNAKLRNIDLSLVGAKGKFENSFLSANLTMDFEGTDPDYITGNLDLKGLELFNLKENLINLKKLDAHISKNEEDERVMTLDSDWLEAEMSWNANIKDLGLQGRQMMASVMPSFFKAPESFPEEGTRLDLSILIHPDNTLTNFFNLPVKLLVPVHIAASMEGAEQSASLSVDVPYLQQGKDKLIYDTRLTLNIEGLEKEFDLDLTTTMPAKKGDVIADVALHGHRDVISADIGWRSVDNPAFKGLLSLDAHLMQNFTGSIPDINVRIKPTKISLGNEDWFISEADLNYSDKILSVTGFNVGHDDQFVQIDGKASSSFDDVIRITLSGIDVDYVFDTLKINYVTFGGEATGVITGRALFSGEPIAQTEKLIIKDLSYNGAVVGDGDITSHWDNDQKEVAIAAIISKNGHQRVDGSGGVFLGADSLCFDIKADKVPVEFVQPFMQAFSSHVGGFASGEVRLAGNFHDIDLTGKIFADSVNVKLDYTQTYYHGSDSVYLYPGRIEIPGFRLYDKYGHSALLTGELTHRYFHEPAFNFKLADAENFLCYDTSSSDNPDWYGTVYGNGGAVINGWPGYVDIGIDMTLVGNSNFTFVLNETLAAADYNFLKFTDKRKEAMLASQDTLTDFKSMFRKRVMDNIEVPTSFDLNVRATVTPSVLLTVVMDPKAGDKINARGSGAVQVEYNSDNDKMMMYGKYTIDEGSYNFSLQDLILRDFKIIEGSYITFNGDPLDADLEISAAYRVNTNLSDLDKSFSTDRDLARTNVPVDAILKVDGRMTRPNITFDIDLPTLTQDVERKVKSIISTDDMMSRQIIYLLALNRFYTPEYMGSSGNGGELAAVASTTLSSQLSNMIGQLTDKFTLSPTFRSDKGDFSDLEVDVALSSRLLNNRLLLNGNFGYRDKSTSSTTFIGDFDLEYLLNRSGNLRLKAYNHFNDQNYYLREALTTQGIGVIYRKDFDNPFDLRKKKKKSDEKTASEGSETSGNEPSKGEK